MKKHILLLYFAGMMFCAVSSSAQKFYLNVGGGYNLPNAATIIGTNITDTRTSGTGTTEILDTKNVKGSFGAGIGFGISVGYSFNEHVSAELGGSYLMVKNYKYNNILSSKVTSASDTSQTDQDKSTSISGSMIRIIPGIKITGGNVDSKVRPYAKAGLVVGIGSSLISNYLETYSSDHKGSAGIPDTTGNTSSTFELSGGLSIGFAGAIGIEYRLNKKMAIFGEATLFSQSWAPTTGTVTKWSVNGSDKLASADVYDKSITYTDSYNDQPIDATTLRPVNLNLPQEKLQQSYRFSSFGIALGLHFNFGGK